MAAKKQKPKAVKVKRPAKISAPAAAKPAAYVIPEPNLPTPAEDDPTATTRQESSRYDGDTAIRLYLREIGLVREDARAGVSTVLNAAALTYVAALVSSVLQLLYLLTLARDNRR